jgi:hypothetical protein
VRFARIARVFVWISALAFRGELRAHTVIVAKQWIGDEFVVQSVADARRFLHINVRSRRGGITGGIRECEVERANSCREFKIIGDLISAFFILRSYHLFHDSFVVVTNGANNFTVVCHAVVV